MKFSVVVLLLGFSLGLYGQTISIGETRFSADLNLQHDITTLTRLVGRSGASGVAALAGQTFFLNASIGVVIASSAEPYRMIVELLAGEWQSDGTLVLHRMYLRIDDPVFDSFFQRAEGRQVQVFAHQAELVRDVAGRDIIQLRLRNLITR